MSRTGLDFGFWMVRCDHFSSRRRRIYASEFPLKPVPCRLTPKFNCERLYFHSRNLRPLTDRDSPLNSLHNVSSGFGFDWPRRSYFFAAVAAWTGLRSNFPLLSTKKTHSELASQLVVWR